MRTSSAAAAPAKPATRSSDDNWATLGRYIMASVEISNRDTHRHQPLWPLAKETRSEFGRSAFSGSRGRGQAPTGRRVFFFPHLSISALFARLKIREEPWAQSALRALRHGR